MPITLETISTRHNLLSGGMDITVTFGNVMGCLQAPGRPSGFAVGNPSPMNVIFRTEIEKNTVIVRTALSRTDTENTSLYLYYGYGLMPFCNITDSADRSLPVFGPRSLGILPRATSKFVTKMRISKAMPLPVKINRLSFPDDMKTLELKTREFSSSFCDLHMDLFKSTPDDVLVYYICDIECSELMKLSACIGYDSSIKVWIDGKAVYHDLNGSNPARPDKGLVRFAGTPGRHQILIAQSSNFGRAWGIFLRFARRDVHQKLIRAGSAHYTMPTILG